MSRDKYLYSIVASKSPNDEKKHNMVDCGIIRNLRIL